MKPFNEAKDKLKDKIEKLLNLSMSDNEHEASVALKKALKLMNENNITQDEVYRQNFIHRKFEINNTRLSIWKQELYSSMASLSGCVFSWRNGNGYSNTSNLNVQASITGRERDVENAVYLCTFLDRIIERKTKEKLKELEKSNYRHNKTTYMKSFKIGIIKTVNYRLYIQQNKFFTESKERGLVCIDSKAKYDESMEFLKKDEKKLILQESKSKIEKEAYLNGVKTGEEIELNQAVSKQDEIHQLENKISRQ